MYASVLYPMYVWRTKIGPCVYSLLFPNKYKYSVFKVPSDLWLPIRCWLHKILTANNTLMTFKNQDADWALSWSSQHNLDTCHLCLQCFHLQQKNFPTHCSSYFLKFQYVNKKPSTYLSINQCNKIYQRIYQSVYLSVQSICLCIYLPIIYIIIM